MATVNFPTPIRLLQDAGQISKILCQLPRTVLDEAEKQSDPWTWLARWVVLSPFEGLPLTEAELLKEGFAPTNLGVYSANEKAMLKFSIKEISFKQNAHKPHILIVDRIGWPDSFRKVFLAAASQRNAFERLPRIMRGEASRETDWLEEMLEEMGKSEGARDNVKLEHATEKVALARAPYDLFHADAQNNPNSKVRQENLRYIEKWRKEETKRGRGNAATQPRPLPRATEVTGESKLLLMLAGWWVCFGNSPMPGFMFWGNKAITKHLSNLTGRQLKPDYIKKWRRALRLVPVSGETETPFVWDIKASRRDGAEWKIEGRQRDKTPAFTFWGAIKFNGKPILPHQSLPLTTF